MGIPSADICQQSLNNRLPVHTVVDRPAQAGILQNGLVGAVVDKEELTAALAVVGHQILVIQHQLHVAGVGRSNQIHLAVLQSDGARSGLRDHHKMDLLDIGCALVVVLIGSQGDLLAPCMVLQDERAGSADGLHRLSEIIAVLIDILLV